MEARFHCHPRAGPADRALVGGALGADEKEGAGWRTGSQFRPFPRCVALGLNVGVADAGLGAVHRSSSEKGAVPCTRGQAGYCHCHAPGNSCSDCADTLAGDFFFHATLFAVQQGIESHFSLSLATVNGVATCQCKHEMARRYGPLISLSSLVWHGSSSRPLGNAPGPSVQLLYISNLGSVDRGASGSDPSGDRDPGGLWL